MTHLYRERRGVSGLWLPVACHHCLLSSVVIIGFASSVGIITCHHHLSSSFVIISRHHRLSLSVVIIGVQCGRDVALPLQACAGPVLGLQ